MISAGDYSGKLDYEAAQFTEEPVVHSFESETKNMFGSEVIQALGFKVGRGFGLKPGRFWNELDI